MVVGFTYGRSHRCPRNLKEKEKEEGAVIFCQVVKNRAECQTVVTKSTARSRDSRRSPIPPISLSPSTFPRPPYVSQQPPPPPWATCRARGTCRGPAMGCILGKLATAPGSSLFFPAAATTADGGGGGDNKEVQLQAPQPEHIAAVKKDASGWPLWLSEAAGDALRGWAPRGADAFQKLEKVSVRSFPPHAPVLACLIVCLFPWFSRNFTFFMGAGGCWRKISACLSSPLLRFVRSCLSYAIVGRGIRRVI